VPDIKPEIILVKRDRFDYPIGIMHEMMHKIASWSLGSLINDNLEDENYCDNYKVSSVQNEESKKVFVPKS
jgi:hypothetical protein